MPFSPLGDGGGVGSILVGGAPPALPEISHPESGIEGQVEAGEDAGSLRGWQEPAHDRGVIGLVSSRHERDLCARQIFYESPPVAV